MPEEYLNKEKKTLYLVEKGNGLIMRRDGPSVLIERKNKAPVRIPVNYVDKVIILGNVELDSFSLTLFSSHRIPVLIINRDREFSLILPPNKDLSDLSREQKRLLSSSVLIDKYRSTILRRRFEEERKVIRILFDKISINPQDRYHTIINKIKPSEFLWNKVKAIIANLIQINIIERIMSARLNPHLGVINKACNYGLVYDIYHIFEPEADLQTAKFFCLSKLKNDFANNPHISHEILEIMINNFEKRQAEISNSIDMVISEILEIMRIVPP